MSIRSSLHLHKPVKDLKALALYFVDKIAVIVMDNGENRINFELIVKFHKLLDIVERNSSCKGLITTADGKFYCNGLDLDWALQHSTEQVEELLVQLNELQMRLLLFPMPTLAALNGHAFAGGALFAIAHDLRVLRQDKGWLCFNEVKINGVFVKCHFPLMRTKIGFGHNYTDAIVLGKRYTGPEALSSGLVHAAPPISLLLIESIHLLKSFSGKSGYPRESLQLMKSDVYRDVITQYQVDLDSNSMKKAAEKTKSMSKL
ncbi:hypothetical protein RRG08_036305 [Elysia crispata]|uniref:Uncharacterized protein n=1 Tax=Elysia crispata TaxID=231223 RepID=A0AAE0ZQ46_9GAST|nr:hypothetical protein RRG08_036305 [Elysia crispata]